MAKPEWGTKRICLSCGARFYDFSASPIICPSCGTPYDVEVATRTRKSRPTKAAVIDEEDTPIAAKANEDAEDEDTVEETFEEDADAEEVEDEVVAPAEDEEEEDALIEDVEELGDEDDMSDVIEGGIDEDEEQR